MKIKHPGSFATLVTVAAVPFVLTLAVGPERDAMAARAAGSASARK